MVAWFRGQKDRYVVTIKTPCGSADSPRPPTDVKVELVDPDHAKITWSAPKDIREQNYLDSLVGYRIYRRFANDDLQQRPWWVAATTGPAKRDVVLDLRDKVEDISWYAPHTLRFGVTSIATGSVESELAEVVAPEKK